MNSLGQTDLLRVWEHGQTLHALDRGLVLLDAACPGNTHEALADWPLGRRNAVLAALRCACFGPHASAWTSCPQCQEHLEFGWDMAALAETGAGDPSASGIEVGGRRFRVPTSRDLSRVAKDGATVDGALRLAQACLLSGETPLTMSASDLEELEAALLRADPLAEITFRLDCPECGAESLAALDLVSFVWSEVDAGVKRLLLDVHALASAYAWTESSILGMSAHRRQFYLERLRE